MLLHGNDDGDEGEDILDSIFSSYNNFVLSVVVVVDDDEEAVAVAVAENNINTTVDSRVNKDEGIMRREVCRAREEEIRCLHV